MRLRDYPFTAVELVVVVVIFCVLSGLGLWKLDERRKEFIRQDAQNNPGRYFSMICASDKQELEFNSRPDITCVLTNDAPISLPLRFNYGGSIGRSDVEPDLETEMIKRSKASGRTGYVVPIPSKFTINESSCARCARAVVERSMDSFAEMFMVPPGEAVKASTSSGSGMSTGWSDNTSVVQYSLTLWFTPYSLSGSAIITLPGYEDRYIISETFTYAMRAKKPSGA